MCRHFHGAPLLGAFFAAGQKRELEEVMTIRTICKRDGRQMPFSDDKIIRAITKA